MRHKFWLNREFWGLWMWAIGLALLAGSWGADSAVAATSKEIDVSVDVALEKFEKKWAVPSSFWPARRACWCFRQ